MFLTLLVKQLQYQDPLNPVKNTDLHSQLAQFSPLETLTDMKQQHRHDEHGPDLCKQHAGRGLYRQEC